MKSIMFFLFASILHGGNPFASGPKITTTTLPGGTAGVAYNFQLTATGGKLPYRWSAQSSLPAGISITGDGALIGAPASAGIFWVNVQVLDRNNRKAVASLRMTVGEAPTPPPLTIGPGIPQSGKVGQPYQWQIPIQGGTPPYTCSPDPDNNLAEFGLTLNSDCWVRGTPTKAGQVHF